MGAATKTLYETDFVEWAQRTAELLRSGRLGEADLEHAADEIEDLGRGERSAVASRLQRMLMPLVKQRIQPERDGASWRRSIAEGRAEIAYRFDDHAASAASRKRISNKSICAPFATRCSKPALPHNAPPWICRPLALTP